MGRQCSVKITVIGVGHVGSAVGFVLATRGLAREIVLCARDGEEGRSPPPPVGPVPALQPARWPRCRRVEAVTGNVPQLAKAERKVVGPGSPAQRRPDPRPGGEASPADRHPGVVSQSGAQFPATGPGPTGEESANTSTP